LLPLLSLLSLLSLLTALAIAHLLLHRIDTTYDVARAIRKIRHAIVLIALAHRACRFVQSALEIFDLVSDAAFDVGVRLAVLPHRTAGEVDLFLQPVVADSFRSLLELARRIALVAAHFPGHAIDLLLKLVHFRFELVLPLTDLPRTLARPSSRV
jgi:hypothetical protein